MTPGKNDMGEKVIIDAKGSFSTIQEQWKAKKYFKVNAKCDQNINFFLNHSDFSSAFTFPKIPLANHTTIKILFKYQTVLHFPQRATQDWRLSMKYSMDAYHMKHSPWANLLRLRLD